MTDDEDKKEEYTWPHVVHDLVGWAALIVILFLILKACGAL